MGAKSKRKGGCGEREARDKLREVLGCEARRGRQYSGDQEAPDVITDLPGIHVEVKRCEALSVYKAMQQAIGDAGSNVPLVMHRRNHREWLAVVRFADLPKLAEQLYLFMASGECVKATTDTEGSTT